MSFDPIADILNDIRAGRMVIILDDENRENEGDLVMAAHKVRPEDVNFMVREARGLLCLALTDRRARQLGLRPMVNHNTSRYHTNFTVSIEAANGVTTGISAHDRACTIQAAMKPDARAEDLVQPGHVFPLIAQTGGVFARAGHTEAGCDLAALVGLEPAAVMIEILREDGSMARSPELGTFARKHGLKMGSIDDLICYRLQTEKILVQMHEEVIDNAWGRFRLVVWQDTLGYDLHYALVRANVDDGTPVPVSIHLSHSLSDLLPLKSTAPEHGFNSAMKRLAEEDRGVLLVLTTQITSEALLARLTNKPAGCHAGTPSWRQSGLAAQMLTHLGVQRLRMLEPTLALMDLTAFGLEVIQLPPVISKLTGNFIV